jgi:hypothetical protein
VPQSELLKFVRQLLESLGIEYMLTGSLASSAQGDPRMTHDIDLMVKLDAPSAERLTAAFLADDYYVSDVAVKAAVGRRGMFNVLKTSTGQKIDFYVLPDEEYEQIRFARRVPLSVSGEEVFATTAEDTIVSKLRWAKLCGGSERQMQDALRVFEMQAATLDRAYIDLWIERLELKPLWDELLAAAKPIKPA